jgi:hypothetical protein
VPATLKAQQLWDAVGSEASVMWLRACTTNIQANRAQHTPFLKFSRPWQAGAFNIQMTASCYSHVAQIQQ